MKHGLFIVFEGLDGSGQDTQAELLCQDLIKRGHRIWLTHEPTDGRIGQQIRKMLRNELPHPVPIFIISIRGSRWC